LSRRGGHLSKPELKHVLGFEVLDEIDGFLKRHSVFEPYTPSDFEREHPLEWQLASLHDRPETRPVLSYPWTW